MIGGRRACIGAASALIVLSLAACGSTATTAAPPQTSAGPRTTYVAVGGSDAIGSGTDDPLLDAWPQQFFRHSLPLATVFVNAADPRSTVAEAITDQVPLAVTSRPTVVTVWLVSADLLDGTPAATYATQLLQLLTALRRQGATTVLVANVPPLDQLPGYPACRQGGTGTGTGRELRCPAALPDPATLTTTSAAYDQAIAVDAARTGAVLVDLRSAVAASVARGGPSFLDPTGAGLSSAGSSLVAEAFGNRLRASGHQTA